MNNPKITVVTVVLNGDEVIEKTLNSVINQTYENVEYVVIDGDSKDQTLKKIEKYKDYIDIYLSEADNGIYDAMNKASLLASGEWILFMNAGDVFYNNYSLKQVSSDLTKEFGVVMCGCLKIIKDEIETRKIKHFPENMPLWNKMPTVHQSVIVKTDLQKRYMFNTEFKWCADQDMLLRMKKNNVPFLKKNILLCIFDCEGGKKRNPNLYIKERWKLSKGNARFLERFFLFGKEWIHCNIYGKVISMIKNVLPKKHIIKIRNLRGTR